jgi:hypothetical protein
MLAVASCSHATPAPVAHVSTSAPVAQASTPARSAFVLKAVRVQPTTGADKCPAGSVALSGGPGQCYSQLGTPVTITFATIGPVITDALHAQGLDGFWIVLPAADVAELQAITTTAAHAHANLAISAAGRSWLLPIVGEPFTNGQLEIFLPSNGNSLTSRNSQVLELHRTLVSPS